MIQKRALMRSASDVETKRKGVDWSETYLENDQLDFELENKILAIHKAKFKAGMDSELNLIEARKQAEEIQQLSKAIKKKDRPDSVKLYESNGNSRPGSGNGQKITKSRPTSETISQTIEEHDESLDLLTENVISDDKNTGDVSEDCVKFDRDLPSDNFDDGFQLRPVNVAMFKLSIRRFHHNVQSKNSIANPSPQTDRMINRQSLSSAPSNIRHRPTDQNIRLRTTTRRRPVTSRARKIKDGGVLEAVDIHPVIIFGVNTRKMKDTKSRRELEEMSKIQAEEKLGLVDRKNAERKRLVDWAKGDGTLELKIKAFIKDLEDFKKKDRYNEYSIFGARRSQASLFSQQLKL